MVHPTIWYLGAIKRLILGLFMSHTENTDESDSHRLFNFCSEVILIIQRFIILRIISKIMNLNQPIGENPFNPLNP